jgi:F0F1-type ATP synthase assembly protein I
MVPSPDDRERRDAEDEEGLSGLALAYRKAGPYLGASTQLVASVGLLAGLGYWGDQKLGHKVPWMFLVGFTVGMVGGFVSFFKTVLGQKDK